MSTHTRCVRSKALRMGGAHTYRAMYAPPAWPGSSQPGDTRAGHASTQSPAKKNVNQADQRDPQQCVSDFYNTTPGKVVEFFSPLALLPRWNPDWGENARDWAGAIISKGGALTFTGTGETLTTLQTVKTIQIFPERIVGALLKVGEVAAPPAMAAAASADALAHGVCSAEQIGGLPPQF